MTGFPSNTFFSSLGFSGLGKGKHQKNTFSLTKKPNISARNFAWNKKNHQTYGIFLNLKTSSPHLKEREVYEKMKKTGKLRSHYEKVFPKTWPKKANQSKRVKQNVDFSNYTPWN